MIKAPSDELHDDDTAILGGDTIRDDGTESDEPGVTPPPPLEPWGRYTEIQPLATGGMGHIYRATDTQLGRDVVLKVLRGQEPKQVQRLLREARAQASVEHPGVCRIYDSGSVDGRPYLAMQLIEGVTLGRAARSMTVEEKVRVVAEAADALHAAHRAGLVHRDVKPSNVLVQANPDGGWTPYVVDFGLAREPEDQRLTATDAIVGTPSFLAPEQARGREVDRRSDVYGLGATLFSVLTGSPPFDGGSRVDTVVKLLQEEPRSLRQVDPSLPVDLETIVGRCLEKDPERRYQSMHALAADLRRFLDGEPIVARRGSVWYRLVKRVRKHRVVVAAAAIAAVLLLLQGGVALRTLWLDRQRAETTRRLAQQVLEVESMLRFAALMPAHDTSAEVARARQRIEAIAATLGSAPRRVAAPTHATVGRGLLALGDPQAAREHLERAIELGHRSDEVDLHLGQALAELYVEARRNAGWIGDDQLREQRVAAVDRELRAPALEHLGRASSFTSPGVSAYVQALMASFEGNDDLALQLARKATAEAGWLYEAKHLEGRVLLDGFEEAIDLGEHDLARERFDAARRALEAAEDLARSDLQIKISLITLWHHRHELAVTVGASGDEEFAAAVALCAAGHEIAPDHPDLLTAEVTLYAHRATHLLRQGRDVTEMIEHAIAAGEKVLAAEPDNLLALIRLGLAYRLRAMGAMRTGGDPTADLERAGEVLAVARDLNPNSVYTHNRLGNLATLRGMLLADRGEDPTDAYREAISSLERAHGIDPSAYAALTNLGTALVYLAEHRMNTGHDASAELERAVEAYAQAVELNPNHPSLYNNLGTAYLTLAFALYGAGEDPREPLAEAEKVYTTALELKPNYAFALYNMAFGARVHAAFRADKQLDPAEQLERARKLIARAAAADPTDGDMPAERAAIELVAARWAAQNERSPMPWLVEARQQIDAACALNPSNPEYYLFAAESWLVEARWRAGHESSATAAETGLDAAAKALELNPRLARAHAVRGALLLETSRLEPDGEARRERAREALAKAFEIKPHLQREFADAWRRVAPQADPGAR